MCQMSQKRRFDHQPVTSGLLRKTDIIRVRWRVSEVPATDLGAAMRSSRRAVHAVSRRIAAHLRRTSIQRRGLLNHNWTAGGLSTRLWSRATEPPRSGVAMEPYDQASVLRTCRGFVARRDLRVPCQNSISRLASLFSRPCCRPPGMQPRKVAVMEVVVMAAVITVVVIMAVVMVAQISVVAAIVVDISAAVRTSALVGATPSTT